jgi:hypothetical protein
VLARLATKWTAAVELARRASGEQLSTWEAAEAIAAEAASTLGAPELGKEVGDERLPSRSRPARRGERSECGLRAVRWPWLRWDPPAVRRRPSRSRAISRRAPLELDRRFRAAIAFLQRIDFEIGRILRQILERRLYRELGFESFEDYVVERLDLSPRTARRLVRLARAPEAVATAFREGRITLLAAEAILRGAPLDETVTLRKLQEQVRPAIDFWAPRSVARPFLAWSRGGAGGCGGRGDPGLALAQPGHEIFEATTLEVHGPACSARRNLHPTRRVPLSRADEPWNLTTLCTWHISAACTTG